MKIYINPNCKKIRGSHLLEVCCAQCKCPIAIYQKVGESNFVKMYNDRIVKGSIDFSVYHGALFCPQCNARIATRYITKMDHKEAYRLVPSAFHKKRSKHKIKRGIIRHITIDYLASHIQPNTFLYSAQISNQICKKSALSSAVQVVIFCVKTSKYICVYLL